MPIVQIDFMPGRTPEQKQELVTKVTEAICDTAKCPPESVTIIIREPEIAKAGKFLGRK